MKPVSNVISGRSRLAKPPKKLAKPSQPTKRSRSIAHFPVSGQTSGEESDATNDSSFEFKSSGEESSSESVTQPVCSSSTPKPGVRSSEYIIINGKLCSKSKITKPYACTHGGCGKSYRKPSRLEEHERSHTGERPFVCTSCQKAYLRESHLRAHSRSHLPSSARPFVCTHQVLASKPHLNQDLVSTQQEPDKASTSVSHTCNQRFWTMQHLRAHELAIHLGEKPYKCTSCSATFAKHGALRTHTAENHAPPGTKSYQCGHPGCSQSFSTNQKLKTHSRTHDATRYACAHPECSNPGQNPVQFATWTQLQGHMRSEHPPKCPYVSCSGRRFASSKGLRGHLKIHDNREREEMCLQNLHAPSILATGSKRAYDKPNLSLVEPPLKRRRGGEIGRDWPCPRAGCDKEFKSKKAQTNHVRVSHEGSRNFPCPKDGCSQSFGYKHVMQRHLERHHCKSAGPSLTLAPAPTSTIEALTGQQRSAKNRPRLIDCPWPNAFGADPVSDSMSSADQITIRCALKFSRAYDLRRHLNSAHGLNVEAEEVSAWVEDHKC